MRFDLRSPDPARTTDLYAAAVDMAEWAETRGGILVALSEHHASPDGYLPSPLTLASAIAARTSSIPIMIAAALLPLYDPVRLAEEMVVLDHLSRGRVSYVFGLGYRVEEYALYGIPMHERARRAEANLARLLRALGDGPDRVTPAPYTSGGPSIAWGGQSEAAARRAARFGLDFLAQTDGDALDAAYRQECARLGRAPGNIMLPSPASPTTTFVAEDLDAAWAELGPYLLHDATMYSSWNPEGRTVSISRATTTEDLREERGAHRVFTVSEAVAHLRTHGLLPLHPLCGGLPPERAWPYLRRVVDDVLPAAARS
jgi:alkanesulfonate monooxygenase SsuD/methylene tetrahydromethanopterin reductase-like flavin-dependent oxidoreductase (luciferase family)